MTPVPCLNPPIEILLRHQGPTRVSHPPSSATLTRFPSASATPAAAAFVHLRSYPCSADDNQYHLQALRHLYVLAVQRRGVDAVDVDTGERLFVPLSVSLRRRNGAADAREGVDERPDQGGVPDGGPAESPNGGEEEEDDDTVSSSIVTPARHAKEDVCMRDVGDGDGDDDGDGETRGTDEGGSGLGGEELGAAAGGGVLSLVTPCVLPDLSEVSMLSINSPRYFPVELDIAGNPAVAAVLRRRCRIYVKRRVGHLSYKNVREGRIYVADKKSEVFFFLLGIE